MRILTLLLWAAMLSTGLQTAHAQCTTPTNLHVVSRTPYSVTVSWDAMPRTREYEVRYREVSEITEMVSIVDNNILTIPSALYNSTFEVTVKGWCFSGETSEASAPFNATTLAMNCDVMANVEVQNESCVNCNDGMITVNATGGDGNYLYSWNTNAFQSSNMFSGVADGEHTIHVRDGRGCHTWVKARVMEGVCASPDGFGFAGITSTSAMLNWFEVAGAINYQIRFATSLNPDRQVRVRTAPMINLTSLTPNTQYFVEVLALCSNGYSQPARFAFTTQPGRQQADLGTQSEGVVVYPNPASGVVNVNFESNGNDANIQIFDMTGKLVHETIVVPAVENFNQASIDLSNQQSGVYTLRISQGGQTTATRFSLK